MNERDRIIKPEDLIEGNVSTLGGPPQKDYRDNFRGAKNFPQVLHEANEVFKKLIRRKKVSR